MIALDFKDRIVGSIILSLLRWKKRGSNWCYIGRAFDSLCFINRKKYHAANDRHLISRTSEVERYPPRYPSTCVKRANVKLKQGF